MAKKNPETRNENIRKAQDRGMSLRKIGKMFHISHTQVSNVLKKMAETAQDKI